jgi:MFS transporter, ACS family, solute carrier family 17 (sodium-dependent inorganic phosphate cotransporter), other
MRSPSIRMTLTYSSLVCCVLYSANKGVQSLRAPIQNTFITRASRTGNALQLRNRLEFTHQHFLRKDPYVDVDVEVDTTGSLPVVTSTLAVTAIPPLESKGYVILTLLFLVSTLCALDRVAMSVAILPMGDEFQYNASTRGLISSVFSLGYMVGLIPSGLLGSFSSPKKILAYGVLLWSVAQIATPFAAYVSIPVLLCSRFFMGVAEAVAIPTVQTFVARWVPENQRSVALGAVLSGLQVGNVCAYVASPAILSAFDWKGLFEIYGAVGFLWVALWLPFSQDNPSGMNDSISNSLGNRIELEAVVPVKDESIEQTAALALESVKGVLAEVPWKEILASKEIRAITVAHAVQNFGLYINLAWLPSYFSQKYHLGVADSSLSSVLPWIVAAAVGSGSGLLADSMLQRGVDKTLIRKVAQTFALVVPAVTLLELSTATDLTSTDAIGYFTVACASAASCVAGFGSSVQDVCKNPKLVSTLYGITSAPAVLFGSVGVYLTGVVLDNTKSWDLVFEGTALVYFIGALYYATQYEAKKLF